MYVMPPTGEIHLRKAKNMENKIYVLEDYMTVGCTTGRFCKQPRFAGRES